MTRRGLWTVAGTAHRLGVTPADVEDGLAGPETCHAWRSATAGSCPRPPCSAWSMMRWLAGTPRATGRPSCRRTWDIWRTCLSCWRPHALLSACAAFPDLPAIGVAAEFAEHRQRLVQLVADLLSRYGEQVDL